MVWETRICRSVNFSTGQVSDETAQGRLRRSVDGIIYFLDTGQLVGWGLLRSFSEVSSAII
jgi:hypothetical protein